MVVALCSSSVRLQSLLSSLWQVVFRSGSAQVFLFVQMSSEMWDFDCNGRRREREGEREREKERERERKRERGRREREREGEGERKKRVSSV